MIAKFRQIWHSAVKWKELFLIYFFSIPATFSFLQVRHVCKFRAFFFCYVNVFASDLYSFAKAYSEAILLYIKERKGLFFLKKMCFQKKDIHFTFLKHREGVCNSYQSLFVLQVWRRSRTSKWIYCIVDPSTTTRKWRGTVPPLSYTQIAGLFHKNTPLSR